MPVKSKVKQQLQQARALHEHRGKARQQRLHAAVEPRSALVTTCLLPAALLARPHPGVMRRWFD